MSMTTSTPNAGPNPTGGGAQKTPTPQAAAGAFTAHRMGSAKRNPYIKELIYGQPGSGKTTLAGSAADVPAMCDVLVISAEGGSLVMEDNDRIQNIEAIDEIRVKNMDQLKKVHEFCKYHCRFRDSNDIAGLKKLQAMIFNDPEDPLTPDDIGDHDGAKMPLRYYRTVIVDSLTEIEAQNLVATMGLDSDAMSVGNVDTADWGIYRKNNYVIQQIVRHLRDLPMNVILICGVRYTQDEMKKFHYTPALTGALVSQVQGFVDVVGYLIISAAAAEAAGKNPAEAQMRRLYVQPIQAGPKFDAKCRRASFKGAWLEDPTMESMMRDFKLIA